RRTKLIVSWNPESKTAAPPAPFEVADAVLQITAPLWGPNLQIEPFFVNIFINEFCSLIPGKELHAAREQDFFQLGRAVIISAWVTFLSLHLGSTDPIYLDR